MTWTRLSRNALYNTCTVYTSISAAIIPSSFFLRKSRHMSDQGDEPTVLSKGSSLLSTEMEELSGVYYRPRTRETKATYEVLLSFIQKMIGDQVHVHCSERVKLCLCIACYTVP